MDVGVSASMRRLADTLPRGSALDLGVAGAGGARGSPRTPTGAKTRSPVGSVAGSPKGGLSRDGSHANLEGSLTKQGSGRGGILARLSQLSTRSLFGAEAGSAPAAPDGADGSSPSAATTPANAVPVKGGGAVPAGTSRKGSLTRFFSRSTTASPKVPAAPAAPVAEVKKEVKVKDEAGNKHVNNYLMLEVLGRGAYGKVRRCMDESTGTERAVKIIRKSILKRKRVGRFGNALQTVQQEIAVWKKLEHPNVVKLFAVIDDETSDKLYMVGEYIDGGAVMPDERVCEPISLSNARRYVAQLIDGLSYLHFQRVIHRDIKPGNLLIDKGSGALKITDFGVSQVYDDDDTIRNTAGTAAFLAPEMLTGASFSGKISDIWAVGITLYMFLFGTTPFLADTVPEIYDNIRGKDIPFPAVSATGKALDLAAMAAAMDLIRRLLDRNPATRITLEEARTHPFLLEDSSSRDLLHSLPSQRIEVTEAEVLSAISSVVKLRAVVKATLVAKRSLAEARMRLKIKAALAFSAGIDEEGSAEGNSPVPGASASAGASAGNSPNPVDQSLTSRRRAAAEKSFTGLEPTSSRTHTESDGVSDASSGDSRSVGVRTEGSAAGNGLVNIAHGTSFTGSVQTEDTIVSRASDGTNISGSPSSPGAGSTVVKGYRMTAGPLGSEPDTSASPSSTSGPPSPALSSSRASSAAAAANANANANAH